MSTTLSAKLSSTSVALGQNALSNATSSGTNNRNIAIGSAALFFTSSGVKNVGVGSNSLGGNTTGNSNIGIGDAALSSTSTSSGSIAIGRNSLLSATSGPNISIGDATFNQLSSGTNNIAIGAHSNSTSVTTGSENTIVGSGAGQTLTTGSNNVLIGSGANVNTAAQTNCIILGRNAAPATSVDNQMIFGGTSHIGIFSGSVCYSVGNSISAAGTTQGTATNMTKTINNVTSSGGSATGVKLPSLTSTTVGQLMLVKNNSANSINVYPASSQNIDNLANNTSVAVASGSGRTFAGVSSSSWMSL
jgi:hypothetical protein